MARALPKPEEAALDGIQKPPEQAKCVVPTTPRPLSCSTALTVYSTNGSLSLTQADDSA